MICGFLNVWTSFMNDLAVCDVIRTLISKLVNLYFLRDKGKSWDSTLKGCFFIYKRPHAWIIAASHDNTAQMKPFITLNRKNVWIEFIKTVSFINIRIKYKIKLKIKSKQNPNNEYHMFFLFINFEFIYISIDTSNWSI